MLSITIIATNVSFTERICRSSNDTSPMEKATSSPEQKHIHIWLLRARRPMVEAVFGAEATALGDSGSRMNGGLYDRKIHAIVIVREFESEAFFNSLGRRCRKASVLDLDDAR